jgi:hypothetical protein
MVGVAKTSCELNCTSKSFSCNFLDLAVKQILKIYPVISLTNVLDVHMPHVHFNISITAKLVQMVRVFLLCSTTLYSF